MPKPKIKFEAKILHCFETYKTGTEPTNWFLF